MNYTMQNQRGYAAIGLAAVFGIVALLFVLGYSRLLTKTVSLQQETKQINLLQDLKADITSAYIANAWDVDGPNKSQYRDIAKWFSVAGIQNNPLLHGDVSNTMTKGDIQYTVVAIWLDADGDTSNPALFDKDTGEFRACMDSTKFCPNRPYVLIDGYTIQLDKYNRTLSNLNEIALKLETYFKARFVYDPDHDMSMNYFKPTTGSCTTNNSEDLPCIQDYTPISATGIQHKLGIDSRQLKNSWGQPILVSNITDSTWHKVPFTMAIKTELPWGGAYTVKAVQPL